MKRSKSTSEFITVQKKKKKKEHGSPHITSLMNEKELKLGKNNFEKNKKINTTPPRVPQLLTKRESDAKKSNRLFQQNWKLLHKGKTPTQRKTGTTRKKFLNQYEQRNMIALLTLSQWI